VTGPTGFIPIPGGAEQAAPTARLLPVLHAVTNDEIVGRAGFLDDARAVMHAGGERVAVQLRTAQLTGTTLYAICQELAETQDECGAWLIVNDRVDAALAAGARGVQLTSRSMRVDDARRVAPGLAIGASVHALAEAREAARAGADWCVAGHVFESRGRPGAPGRGLAFLADVCRTVSVPVFGIGGIRPEHLPLLREAGARGAAVIRGIWDAPNTGRAAIEYLSSYDAHGGP
jgi:thiazole tautomerase (transcriptional regulator TenI)